ncbi:MAG TPA: hypothetical protein PK961_13675 [bacterium]|nr:hypothetical protein [bacterium]
MRIDKRLRFRLLLPTLFVATVLTFLPGVPACDDRDRDNIGNSEDNCGFFYNPGQADEDADGVGDACDTDTPLHGHRFAACYVSRLTPPTGAAYENVRIALTGDEKGHLLAAVDLPPELYYHHLTGEAYHNERDIALMSDDKTTTTYYALFTEGATATVGEDDIIESIQGVYTLLYCPNCYGDPDAAFDYVNWSDLSAGEWLAEAAAPEVCGLEETDDDTVDDDTIDDDAADDDAADDDATDDDAVDDDDDDDDDGCGC